jgi:hypothetical protein
VNLDRALARGQAAAERLHTDTFAVYRATGETATDPDTLEERPVYATVHGSVKGKLQATQSRNLDVQVPGVKLSASRFEWHTPVSTDGVLTDDEVVCLTSVTDPEMVGVRVRVTGPFIKTHATARRFEVIEIS